MTTVYDLDLPELDTFGLERAEAVQARKAAGERHWLARMPLGFVVTRYDDVVAVLRDRRWHSAVGMATAMLEVPDTYAERRRQSILAMEGADHTRLRRLAAPAFTPASADRLRPFMRTVINGLVDEIAGQGRCDLVADICD